MDEEMETGFDDFMSGLEGEPTSEPEAEEVETTEAPEAEQATSQEEEPEATEAEETFTIKVNKEERQVNRDEMTALAQKGADYDRVKGQLAKRDTENQSLHAQVEELGKYSGAIKMLESLANKNGTSVDDLVKEVRKQVKVSQGMTEREAELEMRAEDSEAKVSDQTETRQERIQREVREFKEHYPEVELTQELCESLSESVQSGKSLLEAYENKKSSEKDEENAQLKSELEELRKQLEAEKQNAKNRQSSPGPQSDSGGRHAKDDFNDFMGAFA